MNAEADAQRIEQLEKERNDPMMLGTLYFGEGFGRFGEPSALLRKIPFDTLRREAYKSRNAAANSYR